MEYIAGINREQTTLFPELIDDYISYENPVRFIDAFVEQWIFWQWDLSMLR